MRYLLALWTLAACGEATLVQGEDSPERDGDSALRRRPVILAFSAAPASVALGGEAVLSWTVAHASRVTLSPGIGNVATTGSVSVSPSTSTRYTLTAWSAAGSASASLTVAVVGPPQLMP